MFKARHTLLHPSDFATVAATDQWTFHVSGSTLFITRTKIPEDA